MILSAFTINENLLAFLFIPIIILVPLTIHYAYVLITEFLDIIINKRRIYHFISLYKSIDLSQYEKELKKSKKARERVNKVLLHELDVKMAIYHFENEKVIITSENYKWRFIRKHGIQHSIDLYKRFEVK